MLDIKRIRETPEKVKAAMRSRNKDMDELVDEVLAIDVKRRELMSATDAMKQEQNAASRDIPRIKKEGGDIAALMTRMNQLKESIKLNDAQLAALEVRQQSHGQCKDQHCDAREFQGSFAKARSQEHSSQQHGR